MTKTAKRNPFASRDERIAQLEREVQSLRDAKIIKMFADNLLQSIGVILINKPYDNWPEEAKYAFEHERERAPVAAELYAARLPK